MGRILLVEDDPNVADALSMFFEALGHDVHNVSSVRDALAAIRHQLPDLVIADEVLTDGRGSDLLRSLAADYGGTARILLTAGEAGDIGPVPHHTLIRRKPWDIRDAEETLRALLPS